MKSLVMLVGQLAVMGGSWLTVSMADVQVSENVAAGGITGLVIILGGAAVQWYLNIRKERSEQKRAEAEAESESEDRQAERERKARKDALEEWKQTVDDLRQQRELDRQEIHDLRDALQAEKLAHATSMARLESCEKKWNDRHGDDE